MFAKVGDEISDCAVFYAVRITSTLLRLTYLLKYIHSFLGIAEKPSQHELPKRFPFLPMLAARTLQILIYFYSEKVIGSTGSRLLATRMQTGDLVIQLIH